MFKVFWLAIKDTFDELFLLIGVNLLWALISLPLIALAVLFVVSGATALAVVTLLLSTLLLGPAMAGLYTVAERISEGRTAKLGLFFEGLRTHARWSWQVYGAWMFGLLLIVVNLRFYAGMQSIVGTFLQVLFLYFFFIWMALLIYIGPLMVLQADKRLRVLARNAFLMTLGRPVFTFVTFVLMVLIIALSAFLTLPAFVITFSLLAIWGIRATNKLIKDAEERRTAMEAKAAAAGQNQYSAEKGRGGQIRPRE
jgi:uncharacterized membrane protein YesL